MRILGIRLQNYRGVADRRIEFPSTGVTVIEGANEAGKSSFAEALDLIFDELDSTSKRGWQAVRPVDQDVGTRIDVEVETGPYRFLYRKCFFKSRSTVLRIERPQPEHLLGREAHERVRAILAETMDDHLWRSLRVQQGTAVDQPPRLDQAPSLAQALDESIGGDRAGDNEMNLVEAVHDEFAKYFTERGAEKKTLKRAAAAEQEASVVVGALEQELGDLEQDIGRSEELQETLAILHRECAEAERDADRMEKELRALDEKQREASRLELALKAARTVESAARKEHQRRVEDVARVEQAARDRTRLERLAAHGEPALREAERRVLKQRDRYDASRERIQGADEVFRRRERDVDFRHGELDLAQLQERRGRIESARERAQTARELLDRTRIDDELLHEIRELSALLAVAQAQLDAGSPQLRLRALALLEGELDGEAFRLEAGDETERTVPASSTLEIPGCLELRVTAGTSVERLLRERDRIRGRIDELLEQAGLPDLAAAEEANQDRKEALRTLSEAERAVQENLRDLDFDRLCEKIKSTGNSVAKYRNERPADPSIAADYDSAVAAKRAAKQTLALARKEAEEAQAGFSATDLAWQELRREIALAGERVRLATEAERKLTAALNGSRALADDLQLEQDLRLAEEKTREAERIYSRARQEFSAQRPNQLRENAVRARESLARDRARLAEAQKEQHEVAARLELLGERGLFEKLQDARTKRVHADREFRALQRRAAAAKLLFETMREAREKAQRSYAGPLRDRINELGAPVFGEDFSVELDDELRIHSRTLGGVTLPLSSLSVGAREQLSLIARLACALTVDPAEGVPLIFDDTLGYSDPVRLRAMISLLGGAGRHCQVIALTCTPQRFDSIADVHVVRL